jgi:hypothetical protein
MTYTLFWDSPREEGIGLKTSFSRKKPPNSAKLTG